LAAAVQGEPAGIGSGDALVEPGKEDAEEDAEEDADEVTLPLDRIAVG
jgi:hypothetical protein